jgi:hypothetical protein
MMQTYHFDEIVVNNDGVLTLEGLPPSAKVAVMVINPEPFDWQETMRQWIAEMKHHPFARMDRQEILKCLRQSREKIYEEDYGHRHAD